MDVAAKVGWAMLPTTVKLGVGAYYVLCNARKTYETVAWFTSMMPSRNNTTKNHDDHSTGWVWVGNELPESVEFEKL